MEVRKMFRRINYFDGSGHIKSGFDLRTAPFVELVDLVNFSVDVNSMRNKTIHKAMKNSASIHRFLDNTLNLERETPLTIDEDKMASLYDAFKNTLESLVRPKNKELADFLQHTWNGLFNEVVDEIDKMEIKQHRKMSMLNKYYTYN
jgi:AAA+ ATPase superfamily predicted ATPase